MVQTEKKLPLIKCVIACSEYIHGLTCFMNKWSSHWIYEGERKGSCSSTHIDSITFSTYVLAIYPWYVDKPPTRRFYLIKRLHYIYFWNATEIKHMFFTPYNEVLYFTQLYYVGFFYSYSKLDQINLTREFCLCKNTNIFITYLYFSNIKLSCNYKIKN